MFIQTYDTPNPNALKLLLDREISPAQPVYFDEKDKCSNSVLARRLFSITEVEAVFLGKDFITITKSNGSNWNELKPEILIAIHDHFESGLPVFDVEIEKEALKNKGSSGIEQEIIDIIDSKVRPSVAMDGGDIEYHSFENGIVRLRLKGACSGCPISTITLKRGIESLLKFYIPEVESVEAIND